MPKVTIFHSTQETTTSILRKENYVVDDNCFLQSIKLLACADLYRSALNGKLEDPTFNTLTQFSTALFNKVGSHCSNISDHLPIMQWCNQSLTEMRGESYITNILDIIVKQQMNEVQSYLKEKLLPILKENASDVQNELIDLKYENSMIPHECTIGAVLYRKGYEELCEQLNSYCSSVNKESSEDFLSRLTSKAIKGSSNTC